MKKGIVIFNLMVFISCENLKQPEKCGESDSSNFETVVSFSPKLIPLSISYSSQYGLFVSPSFSFDVGFGSINFTTTLSNPKSQHRVTIILRNNNPNNGWGDKTYYLENTDDIKVYIKHDAGFQKIEFHKDQLLIDFTNESFVLVCVEVNNVYNPEHSTNRQLTVTATKLNARYDAGKQSQIFTVLDNGEHLEELGNYKRVDGRKWIQVCYENNKLWVSSKYVE
jgi:hypothetical protein